LGGIGVALPWAMHVIVTQGDESAALALAEGISWLGGSSDDDVRVAQAPPRAFVLRAERDQLTVRGARSFRVDGRDVPAEVELLVLPDEVVELADGASLRCAPPTPVSGTATGFLVRGMLAGGDCAPAGPSLTVVSGLDLGRVFAIAEGASCLGRGGEVELRIRDRATSRRHARVRCHGGEVSIADLGAPNGVLVNGAKIAGSASLAHGDVIQVGQTFLKFRGDKTVPGLISTPEPPGRTDDQLLVWLGAAFATAGVLLAALA
jgi:hypothetical protein